MRVAFVSNGLNTGGSERTTVNLANGLSQIDGMDVFVITGSPRENEYELAKNIGRLAVLEKNIFKDSLTIRRVSKQYSFDIVIGMGIFDNFCVCIANHFIKTKMIISERNDPKHDRLSWKSKLLRNILYPKADGYVFQTQEAKMFYKKSIQKKGTVIHNPVKKGLPKRIGGRQEIIAVGRLDKQKNYEFLIGAFMNVHRRFPNYILRIFGKGPEEENLKNIVESNNLENSVIFEGFKIDVHEDIKKADIFVLSSDYEGMPNSLMEAMAMGFPVIATNCPCGGPRELIQNGINGLLVDSGNYAEMEKQIISLIEDRNLNKALSNCAKNINDTHSLNNICNQWKEYFDMLIG